MKKFLSGLVIVFLAILALLFIPSPQPDAPMPWEITLMPDGNIKVLGIHLGTTTYEEAQQQLHEFGTPAIFTQQDAPASVEAYFPSIHLGGLSGKVILNLAVDPVQIPQMLHHAMEARIQPSGARKYTLSNADKARLLRAPVIALTYIPSIRLNAEMIRARFGEPATRSHPDNEPNTEIWHYPRYGLLIHLQPNHKALFEYAVIP